MKNALLLAWLGANLEFSPTIVTVILVKISFDQIFAGAVRRSEISEGPERVSPVLERVEAAAGKLPEVQDRFTFEEIRFGSSTSREKIFYHTLTRKINLDLDVASSGFLQRLILVQIKFIYNNMIPL